MPNGFVDLIHTCVDHVSYRQGKEEKEEDLDSIGTDVDDVICHRPAALLFRHKYSTKEVFPVNCKIPC